MSDSIEIIDTCEQGSPEWFALHLGIPSASRFADVLASGRAKGSPSETRRKYVYDKAGEIITGTIAESWGGNGHTERGKRLEPEARTMYCIAQDVEVRQISFIRRGRAGASPDSLVGDAGLLEIKTKLPRLQMEVLEANEVPTEHIAQVQGQLWISAREWCDFVSYCPGLEIFIKRVYRDEKYIAELAVKVQEFNSEVDALVSKWGSLRRAA